MMSHRILIADNLHPITEELLRDRGFSVDRRPGLEPEALREILADYDAVLVRSGVRLDADLISEMQRCRVIGRAGVGVDNIDVLAATENGIVVMNVPAGTTISVAEHTLALMLSLIRQISLADASIRRGEWSRSKYTGRELHRMNVGVIGLGRIGQRVAELLRAFGVSVLGYDPHVSEAAIEAIDVTPHSLNSLLGKSDIVTLHLPLNESSRHLIGVEEVGRMKKGAYLINAARGGLVDETAVAEALESGHLAGAAFDVFESEPPEPSSGLMTVNSTVLTPHIAASTDEAQERVGREMAEQVADFLERGEATGFVNARGAAAVLGSELQPVTAGVRKLGQFIAAITGQTTGSVLLRTWGPFEEEVREGLVLALQSGILGNNTNLINASARAERFGLQVEQQWEGDHELLPHLMRVEMTGRNASVSVALDGTPRLVQLDDRNLDLELAGHLLVITHRDEPGMLAEIAATLGAANVNISGLTLARGRGEEEARAVIRVDERPSHDVIARISDLSRVVAIDAASLDHDT